MKVSGSIQSFKPNQESIPKHPVKFKGMKVNDAVKQVLIDNNTRFLNKYGIMFFKFLGEKKGEVLTNSINAIGTGLVAPMFIYYNPLSSQDKDTRKYSAWRQPLSAVLSAIIQIGVTVKLNKFLEKLANEGKISDRFCIKLPQSFKDKLEQYKNSDKINKLNKKEIKGKIDDKLAQLKEEFVHGCLTEETAETLKKYGLMENDIKEMLAKDRVKDAIGSDPKYSKLIDKVVDFIEKDIKNTEFEPINSFLSQNADDSIKQKVLEKLENAYKAAESSSKKLFETKLTENEVKEMSKKIIKITSGRFDALNNIVGALVATALVPFTCSALNWVYPRFMDMFFPELSQPKKQGGK